MTDGAKAPDAFADGFSPGDEALWQKYAALSLKGVSLDRLKTATYDGFLIDPLARRRADVRPLAARRSGAWQVMQRIEHPAPDDALAQVRDDLENGATGLTLIYPGAPGSHGFGIDARHETLARILSMLDPAGGVAVELDLGHAQQDATAALIAACKSAMPAPGALDIRFGFDPIGAMAQDGGAPQCWSTHAPQWAGDMLRLADAGLRGPFAVADGRVVHNAGGSEAQELACVLATAIAYLRAWDAAGIAPAQARGFLFFRLAADAEFFLTIAKCRALRKLWSQVEEACGIDAAPIFISAQTAWRMQTQRDVHVNMIRNTIAACAAGLGGADAVAMLPHTTALGLPDRFARRVARNAQRLLLDESHLAAVGDPAAGSGGIEALTDQLCQTAWTLFQDIEASGGMAAALESGTFQAQVSGARGRREAAIATRHDSLTGTTDFPLLDEARVGVLAAAPKVTRSAIHAFKIAPLLSFRLAEPYEALRDASDQTVEQAGQRPLIFLAGLGALADFGARATFARQLFAAGGIAATGADEESDAAQLVQAFKRSGARIACICGTHDICAQQAPAVAAILKAAGARHLYLAGRPASEKQDGIDTYVFQGCDVLTTLRAAHAILRDAGQTP